MQPDDEHLPAAVLAEATAPLPGDVPGFHDALLQAADAHDPIRMDHLVHGWAQARAELLPVEEQAELAMQAVLDRRLGQVLFGAGHPAAAQVLSDALGAAVLAEDEVETLRCHVALVPVEVLLGDAEALAAGRGYVEQLQALGEPGHAAGGLMGLAQVAPPEEGPVLVLRASHLYEQAGDGGWAAEAAVLAARALAAAGDPRGSDVLERARHLVDAHATVELRVALAEVEAIVLWQSGEPETAAALLGAAIEASERTGRPVAPDLQILLCDILVEGEQWDALHTPASALVRFGQLVDDDELESMGVRYLRLSRGGDSTERPDAPRVGVH
ncbi:hypothetical protein SAMN04489867_0387 [Pedococcus dokdonensis]|uniref:Tetratricopeptide repeat protein n=1 Tax=Pedococcus dokdonensis TaxID=443156 RepID=A0A1H0LTI3_9MICO|nr:hypothetical protein [Pedococcus dokdonensis]SDO71190.1 hypothetical protein SAMN04489867_0387 [Pedococcus dokdonensis]